jgi:hypothetical protein
VFLGDCRGQSKTAAVSAQKTGRRLQRRPVVRLGDDGLRSSRQTCDEGNHEQDDEHPKQQSRGIHCESSDAAKPNQGRNHRDDQKDNGIMKKIAHDGLRSLPASSACWH